MLLKFSIDSVGMMATGGGVTQCFTSMNDQSCHS